MPDIPYLTVGQGAMPSHRPLLELVDDHRADCRCSLGKPGRGYPHHLVPTAQPAQPARPGVTRVP